MAGQVGQLVELPEDAWANFRGLRDQLEGRIRDLTQAHRDAENAATAGLQDLFNESVVWGLDSLEKALWELAGMMDRLEQFMKLIESVPDKIIVVKFCRGVRESKM